MQSPAALSRRNSIPLAQKPYWSLDDAAEATTLSKRKLQQMIASGALRVARGVGTRIILDPADVKAALFGDSTPAA